MNLVSHIQVNRHPQCASELDTYYVLEPTVSRQGTLVAWGSNRDIAILGARPTIIWSLNDGSRVLIFINPFGRHRAGAAVSRRERRATSEPTARLVALRDHRALGGAAPGVCARGGLHRP